MYWSLTGVDWQKQEMLGVARKPTKNGFQTVQTNAWGQYGVYCLYDDYTAVYVGRAFKLTIGERISSHLRDRLAGRWDSFSWFGVNRVTLSGNMQKFNTRLNTREAIVKALEAFAIIAFDPRLNRRREQIPGADEFVQKASARKATRTLIEEIHARLPNNASATKEQRRVAVVRRSL
jgi:hypothetical protein